MAKPIRATPKLTVAETKVFIENMVEMDNSKPSAEDRKIIKQINHFL